ncbi:MAG TPA: transcription-repair coupling factor [Verrucomicrobiae bacterium]|jgi:transcription-repair coupling factor (superfamily II helicase)|nr:transcription-repair coupling factor [Verrucomicrobiae bacterium]
MSKLQERIEPLVAGRWTGEKRLSGVKGGARGYLLARIAEKRRAPALVIAPTPREAEQLFLDLGFFLGESDASPLEKRLHLFASWEILPFENLSPHPDNIASRLEGLYHLIEGEAPILVSTPAALMQRVIPKEALKRSYRYLVVGEDDAREGFIEHLANWGFQNVPLVEERGDFSVRGAIVDVFPPAYQLPMRLEFAGDHLESIREFDPATQRSKKTLQDFLLLPMKEFSLKRPDIDAIARAIDKRAADLELGRKEKNPLLEAVREGVPFAGMEFLVPYFYPELAPVFSYLPRETLIWIDEPGHVTAEAERFEHLVGEMSARAKEQGRVAAPMESLYFAVDEWRRELDQFTRIVSEALETEPGPAAAADTILVRSYLNSDLHGDGASKEPSFAPIAARFKEWQGDRIFVVAPTRSEATRLKELLAHYEIHFALPRGGFPLEISDEPVQAILVGNLTQGFRLPDERLSVVTADEIFGTKKHLTVGAKRSAPGHFITSLSELKQDDTIVHLDHGIGIYRGLKFLKVAGTEGEYLHLEYEGGDRLYLPVDRINLVQKYIGGEEARPALDRLGGTTWEKVKAKTRKSVMEMAHELVQIYAAREVHEGQALAPPEHVYQEFEAAFEFEETPDQEKAIDDALKDLAAKKPMDRLICGDVGYGKTEVALRAAFVAVMSGKQVALLAPTTILVEQHLETFRRRLRNYPVRIETLSRFSTSKENRQVVEAIGKGLVDIVIGTHRLLQKDIVFRDLGLVVIDEEHRFGVAQKERLRKLRHTAHVMSLTATPIPRTLHMALVGIRDLSVIETPPLDRLAIRTSICRYDEGVIREAVLREIERGGQVFFLHNRVETIERMARKIAELVPEAKVALAHGQMHPRDLERVMADFVENRAQVLICSAIIESGLDFPNANTIIINRADKFGLAQLYQLRGRVGRSHRRAYAYLLIPGETLITRDAERRLKALQQVDELGGGFKLAVEDLEIRGAGNLLGREQSGQIAAVGFELYTEMMQKAVSELKGQPVRPEIEPEIRLGVPAYFPDEYVPDANQRLLFYKRLASLRDGAELEEIREEMRDRFGVFPAAVENLFGVMDVRRMLKEYLVEQMTYNDGRVSLLFHRESPVNVARLVQLVGKNGKFRLSPEGRLSFAPKSDAWSEVVLEVIEFLRSIQIAPPAKSAAQAPSEVDAG